MSTLNFYKIDCFIRAEVMNKEALYKIKTIKLRLWSLIVKLIDFFGKKLPKPVS